MGLLLGVALLRVGVIVGSRVGVRVGVIVGSRDGMRVELRVGRRV